MLIGIDAGASACHGTKLNTTNFVSYPRAPDQVKMPRIHSRLSLRVYREGTKDSRKIHCRNETEVGTGHLSTDRGTGCKMVCDLHSLTGTSELLLGSLPKRCGVDIFGYE